MGQQQSVSVAAANVAAALAAGGDGVGQGQGGSGVGGVPPGSVGGGPGSQPSLVSLVQSANNVAFTAPTFNVS